MSIKRLASCRLQLGHGPLIATAVHDGHDIRPDLRPYIALSESGRYREEDPFTGIWAEVAPSRVIALRSRFEVDLNRPRESAIYRTPEDCWGLALYAQQPPEVLLERSLAEYDEFYDTMHEFLSNVVREHGRFVVFDLHSYNHRRAGPRGPQADPMHNPQVNVGTESIDRDRWGGVVDAFCESLRAADFPGGRLDVRENVKFKGGNWSRWVNKNFPNEGVAIAIEFKKFFMDEWTGLPDWNLISAVSTALKATIDPVLGALERA